MQPWAQPRSGSGHRLAVAATVFTVLQLAAAAGAGSLSSSSHDVRLAPESPLIVGVQNAVVDEAAAAAHSVLTDDAHARPRRQAPPPGPGPQSPCPLCATSNLNTAGCRHCRDMRQRLCRRMAFIEEHPVRGDPTQLLAQCPPFDYSGCMAWDGWGACQDCSHGLFDSTTYRAGLTDAVMNNISVLLLDGNGLDNLTQVTNLVINSYRSDMLAVSLSDNAFPRLPSFGLCASTDQQAAPIGPGPAPADPGQRAAPNETCVQSLLYLGLRNLTLEAIAESAFGGVTVGGCGKGSGLLDMEGSRIGRMERDSLYRSSTQLGENTVLSNSIDSMSLIHSVIDRVYPNAFGTRTLFGHFNWTNLTIMNLNLSTAIEADDCDFFTLTSGIAYGLNVFGDWDLTGLTLGPNETTMRPCWLQQASVFGTFTLSRLKADATAFSVSKSAFYGLDVGMFRMEHANLSKIFLNPSTFSGLSVTSNVSLYGSNFRDNFLPAKLFNGMILNRESNGYVINLSHCQLEVLQTVNSTGPFSGIVSALGSTGQVIDLSYNKIAVIERFAFVGVGCTTLLLQNNRIMLYARKWEQALVTVTRIDTDGNPSRCNVSRSTTVDGVEDEDIRSIRCQCATGFLGDNGSSTIFVRGYCSNASCAADEVESLSTTVTHGSFTPAAGMASGENATLQCDTGYHAVQNSPAQCLGGAFVRAGLGSCVKNVPRGKNKLTPLQTAALVLSLLFFFAAVLGVVRYKYRQRVHSLRNTLLYKNLLLDTKNTMLDEYEAAWKISWSAVNLGDIVGVGGFGSVYRGTWHGNEVAIKVLDEDKFTSFRLDSDTMHSEATVMASLRHPNIVTFFGAGSTPEGGPFIVSEFMTMGALREVLEGAKQGGIEWSRRIPMCRDIAAGMRFLHSRSPPLIHRDLKSDNCLLDRAWVTKVADFGTVLKPAAAPPPPPSANATSKSRTLSVLSKSLPIGGAAAAPAPVGPRSESFVHRVEVTATAAAGTPLWMAPEVLDARYGRSRYSQASDVYSFGCVLYEILTFNLPFADVRFKNQTDLATRVLGGQRPNVHLGAGTAAGSVAPVGYVALMQRCWNGKATERPIFDDVYSTFAKMTVGVLPPIDDGPMGESYL